MLNAIIYNVYQYKRFKRLLVFNQYRDPHSSVTGNLTVRHIINWSICTGHNNYLRGVQVPSVHV